MRKENYHFERASSPTRRQHGRECNMSSYGAAGVHNHLLQQTNSGSYTTSKYQHTSKYTLGFLLLLLVLAVPTRVTCERAEQEHLRYRRQATENSTKAGDEGEPPTTDLLQNQQQLQEFPAPGGGAGGGGAPDKEGPGGAVLPSPAPGVNHPVSDPSRSDDSGSVESGVVIVLTLVCVTLLVIVLVGLAAALRYFILQKRKKSGREALWTEGAHYSPANNPRPPPRRHHSSRHTKNGSINRSTRHSLASHISTDLFRVVYPYQPTDATQLKLDPGCVVEVVEKTDGWWRGFIGHEEGWFPENYVERVYEGSGITLEDYTETMGETLTRHLPGQQNNTSGTKTVTPTREQLRQEGIDEVDFQAARSSPAPPPPPLPPAPPPLHLSLGEKGEKENHGALSWKKEEPLKRSSSHEAEDPTSGDEFILERPIASSPENDLLESIFNDLEKAWGKSEVSTPINKDYYNVNQVESNITPIPLAESLNEETPKQTKTQSVGENNTQKNPEGIYEFNKYMRFQLEAEEAADMLGESLVPLSHSDSSNDANDGEGRAEDMYINTSEERQAAAQRQQTEDLYINCAEERMAAEQVEDLYINCQEERQAAKLDEDKAREDFEAVTRKLDKILMDDALSSSSPSSDADQSYRALYPYTPQNADELAIVENEILQHVDSHDRNWIKVRNTSGVEGLVPCNYISPENSLEDKHQFKYHMSPDTPESDDWDENSDIEEEGDVTAIEYRAIYDYVPQHEGDLALCVGDRVAALSTPGDNGWCKGYCNGNEGWFPAAYVEMATESAPATPVSLSTPPFNAFSIQSPTVEIAAVARAEDVSSSGHQAIKTSPEDLSEDTPPPLPTCPPPTDEELEELEKAEEEKKLIQNPPDKATSPSSSSSTSTVQPTIPHGAPTMEQPPEAQEPTSCHTYQNSAKNYPDISSAHSELNTTYVIHNSKDMNHSSGGVKIGEIPPGGYGVDRGSAKSPASVAGSRVSSSGTDDSEGERYRFRLPKKFGKPKFVKIPKRILLKRAGSVGKRPAPPPPGVHHKVIPEISAPILQQASDPTRIAASQELRVSFKEPPRAEKERQAKPKPAKDTAHASSPGILKNGAGLMYRSPHGGSYVDILTNGHSDSNTNNNMDLNQTVDDEVSFSGQRRNDSSLHHRFSSDSDDGALSPSAGSRSLSADSSAKTPPPRPLPITGVSHSAPHMGPQSRVGCLKQGSVSNTNSPVVHNSSWAVRHNNRYHHSISEDSAQVNGHAGPDSDFSAGPQPRRGRRSYSRPTGAPPPRPKMPPPPRPPGPPPGRVGAHGDGVYTPDQRINKQQTNQQKQFVRLEGLDESHSTTEGPNSIQTVNKGQNLRLKDNSENQGRKGNVNIRPSSKNDDLSHVHLEGGEEAVEVVRFPRTGAKNGVINLNLGLSEPSKASHLTESSDFDEVDGQPGFEVVAIRSPTTNLLGGGPRDSFRKYKKDKSGGKKSSSVVVDIPDVDLNIYNNDSPRMNGDKRRAHTLPNGVSSTDSWPASSTGEMVNGGPSRVETSMSRSSSSLDRGHSRASSEYGQQSWMDDPVSPSKRHAPPRPPPPSVSPEKNRRNNSNRNSKGEIPIKPPRKDKIRRSIDSYQAVDLGEMSFNEDALIKEIGLLPDRPGWSVGLLTDGTMGIYPTDYALTISGLPDSESEVEC